MHHAYKPVICVWILAFKGKLGLKLSYPQSTCCYAKSSLEIIKLKWHALLQVAHENTFGYTVPLKYLCSRASEAEILLSGLNVKSLYER